MTLVRREHTVPLSEAAAFEVGEVRRWVAEVMATWNVLGMIDAGYFSNYLNRFDRELRWISWHGHFLCWGMTRADLIRLRDSINEWTAAPLRGRDAMQFYEPASSRLPGLMLYAAKGPISEYRLFGKVAADELDGDPPAVRALEQRKRPLRPGDAVRTCNAMSDRTLAELIVAVGDGAKLAHEAVARARRL